MNIFPAIDLINGKCVRLEKGDFNKTTTYELEPKDVAKAYQQAGAEFIHVVDLDGAKKGQTCQFETIQKIRENCNMTLQVGGGVKDFETIEKLLELGVDRVVVGSLAVRDIALTKKFFEKYGAEKIVLALDVFIKEGIPYIATHGWQESSTTTLDEILQTYLGDGLEYVLCTDISRDGMLQGPNFELYRIYSSIYPDVQFMASGGVGSLEDLEILKEQNTYGVIIGKALYENKFTLQEALEC
ncbi:1-(5-phosphoribosyl)-5-[(5-phosphoribosylamino)methylideneamino]imidazole-4-carboxamide isomerase [Francisella philomiragia]|uniref:1-(5-phosphoribosyl)-5-[(5- phosphoribosylamino)methylideneamino]imidazole-4- carboxamide isomerase n=1 Tax=Francisella philomiragia TaxID=28110 RepID=UPI0022431587|nr:1-(5-phosphoribosyl)-5-[(5-phosphoribosylamino)methylideneamino]imidazole-4-carboxamide isomerase [Francisella philomiragia]